MAADQVSAQTAAGGQGLLQIDRTAGLEVDKGAARQGLTADIRPETVARQLDRRQAHAIDRDAVAQLDVAQVELAGLDIDPHIAALGAERANGAYGFDYAGEHRTSRGSAPGRHAAAGEERR